MPGLDGLPFVVAVDLGQAADHTAVVALEAVGVGTGEQELDYRAPPVYDAQLRRIGPWREKQVAHYHARHVERLPLALPYPQQVAHVAGLLGRAPLTGKAQLVLDSTGVGRAVTDMFRAAGLRPIAITITSGHTVHKERWDEIHVPKKDLVGVVQVLLQQQRLRITASLPTASLLTQELQSFRQRVTVSANLTYGAAEDWRSAQHDDLVLATALGCWWAEQRPPRWGVL